MIDQSALLNFTHTARILAQGSGFIYLLPHPALRSWISNYTVTFPGDSYISANYTVIPHGSATLVFSLNDSALHSTLYGPATKPCQVGSRANQYAMLVIIEFQPAGLFAFTNMKQSELTDRILPFDIINQRLNNLIADTLYSAATLTELADGMDALLLSSLNTIYPDALRQTTQLIVDNMGVISAKELSEHVYYSERHMNRIFDQFLGMSVKSFSRLVRINKAVRLLNNPSHSVTYACHATGFYDLSHFIRDFESACGLTPETYRKNMSDFYSQIAKF